MPHNNLTTDQIMAAEQLRFIWNAKKKVLHLTQEKLAQLCGWSAQSSFNDYLQSRVPLNIEAILRISKVLQIHPTEIMPALVDLLPPTDTTILAEQKILTHSESMIINILRSVKDEHSNIAINAFNIERAELTAELMRAYEEIATQKIQEVKQAFELSEAINSLTVQLAEKTERDAELVMANHKLAFQNSEKAKHAAELMISIALNEMLREQNNHLQKVEIIGQLTAGISHDFNNILSCILGYNEMNNDIRDDMKDDALKSELDNNTKQIANAGQRAVVLIDKLMTYARKNNSGEKMMDIKHTPDIINEVLVMLRPSLTSKIEFKFQNNCQMNEEVACNTCPENRSMTVPMDAIDLQQVIMNLAVNARDAMGDNGGEITVSLDNKMLELNTKCTACGELIEGDFIQLAVTDNGSGIIPEIMNRIFDPFFTTKPRSKGTGLGLSTIMGLVHSANGHISVESNLSGSTQGTSFKLLFPLPVGQMR